VSVLAAIRPDDWNFPLLVHVLGAALLVGALVTAVTALYLGWRRDAAPFSRFGFWTLLLVGFPAYWVMRVGAEWIYSKEDFPEDDEPAWVGIGYVTADLGLLLLVVSIILTGIGMRRARTGGGPSNFARVGGVLATIVLAAYIVAMWAMTAKPD
jgi:hypothetical protein